MTQTTQTTQMTQNKKANIKYFIYLRDMMDYDDHSFDFLQEQKRGNSCFWTALNCCDTLNSAKEWVIKHGKKYTDEYFDLNEMHCVIKIQKQLIGDYIENIRLDVDRYTPSFENTYCFSEGAYKMLCSEIFILATRDYYEIDTTDFTYIKGKKRINMLPSELIEFFNRYIESETREYDREQLEKLLLSHL